MASQDAALVTEALAGSTQAFATLVERHQRWVLNLAFQLVGDADEAEDVAQEAFVAAYEKLGQLRRRANFAAWLRRIVVHEALRWRRRTRRLSPLTVEVRDDASGAGPHTAVAVQQVLRAMPDHLAVVLVLRELQALSYQDIAETLDIPVGTVRSRLHAARQAFRTLWESER